MRPNSGKGAIALAILSVFLGVTNPKEQDYLDYASEKLVDQAREAICKDTGYCGRGEPPILVTNLIIKPFIQASTKRQDLVLFSIYTTEVPGNTFKAIGVLGSFITL